MTNTSYQLMWDGNEISWYKTLLVFVNNKSQQNSVSYCLIDVKDQSLICTACCRVCVAHQCWCWGFGPGFGFSRFLSGGIPQCSIHRVSRSRNLQLLRQLLQLLARYHWRQWNVYVRQNSDTQALNFLTFKKFFNYSTTLKNAVFCWPLNSWPCSSLL